MASEGFLTLALYVKFCPTKTWAGSVEKEKMEMPDVESWEREAGAKNAEVSNRSTIIPKPNIFFNLRSPLTCRGLRYLSFTYLQKAAL